MCWFCFVTLGCRQTKKIRRDVIQHITDPHKHHIIFCLSVVVCPFILSSSSSLSTLNALGAHPYLSTYTTVWNCPVFLVNFPASHFKHGKMLQEEIYVHLSTRTVSFVYFVLLFLPSFVQIFTIIGSLVLGERSRFEIVVNH